MKEELMSNNELKGILELIIPRLVLLIAEKKLMPENKAITLLYSSQLYAKLEQENSKLWHLSVPALFELWEEEQETGCITYPTMI